MINEQQDLCNWLAEHLFGYRRVIVSLDYNHENGGTEALLPPELDEKDFSWPPKGLVPLGYWVPDWIKDWEFVARWMAAKRYLLTLCYTLGIRVMGDDGIECISEMSGRRWRAIYECGGLDDRMKGKNMWTRYGVSPGEAVCLAAKAALSNDKPW